MSAKSTLNFSAAEVPLMRMRGSILLALFCCTTPAVFATPVLSNPTAAVWKRTTEREVIYAASDDVRLTALCVQIGGASSWIPVEQLSDITLPNLDEVEVVHGMGLLHAHEFVPDWGLWGMSVKVKSLVDVEGEIKDGPTYFFVLSDNQVVYRVLRKWLPAPGQSGASVLDDQWVPVNPKNIGHAPCTPPT